ncbi:MAG TPA: MFS transporter [Polyangiaceae bacterium]|nr:MFS transporter [Polyangiaceae bacterium]
MKAFGPLALLFVALFNSILGLSVLFPILGPLGRQLGFSELQVGALSTSYALAQFVASTYWGRRSEVVGRKPILLLGILGFGVTFLMFALLCQLGLRGELNGSALFACLLLTRVVGGTFSSATLPTAQAYVADVTGRSDRTRSMALIGAAFGLGVVFGPALGALLAPLGLLVPVYVSAGLAFLNAIFVWLKLPEPPRRPSQRQAAPRLMPVLNKVRVLLAIGFTTTLASVAMEQTIAFYFQDRLGLSNSDAARTVGFALVAYGIMAVLVQGVFVRRVGWSPLRLMRTGVPIAAAGLVALSLAHVHSWLVVAMTLQGLGQALTLPGVMSGLSLSVDEDEQGAVAGLNSSSQALARTLGPVLGTGLYQLRPELPYLFGAALLVCVLGFLIASRNALAFRLQAP